MIDHGKKNLLGVNIDAVDYDAAVARFVEAAKNSSRLTVTALAVHGVMTGAWDLEQRHRLNQLDMVVPDGMPVRWGINLLHGTGLPDRVYGPTLMLKVCEAAAREGLPLYFFGTQRETLDQLIVNLKLKFPTIQIAGSEPSQFRKLDEKEWNSLYTRIQSSGAKIVFAGLGCPRQEIWAYEIGEVLNMPVFAVGAAFPFHAGTLPQAPAWMQNHGLEWVYRFVSEPKRLWKRYVFLNPAYLALAGLQWLRIRTADPKATTKPKAPHRFG
jgi:N-acetylglucosaminyldiphosphoundecaprenol N-acetyl-beta-D-mannosaminyltransferase